MCCDIGLARMGTLIYIFNSDEQLGPRQQYAKLRFHLYLHNNKIVTLRNSRVRSK
ncbi:hypothetical protein V6Z12_D12G042300 [Gossypium hirsutum]